MKRYLILLFAGVVGVANSANPYVFKDSKGQVLLTNVINNGNPTGETFTKFTQTVDVTYYGTENWETMTDDEIRQSALLAEDKDGNPVELSDAQKQKRLEFVENYIYQRNLAKKPNAKIGMTTNQVRNQTNWGEPNSINKTLTAYGTIEQWIYDDYQYLYFKNGKLTTIQTHE